MGALVSLAHIDPGQCPLLFLCLRAYRALGKMLSPFPLLQGVIMYWFYTAGQEVKSGQKKKVVILNVDMLKLEVHVSLCHKLVNRKAKKVSLLMTSISMVLKALYSPSIPHTLLRASNANAYR